MYIYGFGQLENMKIESLQDVQLFYGENEAGKSTIMAFIHGIFFGFPTKQQTEVRYEPKHNTKYGGKIRIFLEDQGYVIIERVKGKAAAGDVSVALDNGVLGGEELLKQLLSNIDKGLFQSVFSFNLHGLQNIHQMKSEDIGKFLFSAGTLGSDHLSNAEMELQKELDNRFKPGGKKPFLNEKLFNLHQFNDELKKAMGKNQEYDRLVEQKEAVQKELMHIQESLTLLQESVNKLNEWKKIQSLVVEEKWIETEIHDHKEISFPARGIERFEKLNQLIQPYIAQILSLTERMEKLKKELETLEPNQEILENESDILMVLDKLPLYDQLDFQQKQGEMKLLEYQEKLHSLKEKLHLTLNDDEILLINTNIYMKDQVDSLSRKGKVLKEAKQQLEERFNEEKSTLETLEENVRYAQTQVIPDPERAELETRVAGSNNRKNKEMELKAVQEKIEFYKKTEEQELLQAATIKKQKQLQFFIFGVFFIGLFIYGLATKQLILMIMGGLFVAILGIVFFKSLTQPIKKKMSLTLVELREAEQRLLKELVSPEHLVDFALQAKLALDDRYREELQIQTIKLEQQQQQYERVIVKFEQWEYDAAIHKGELLEISNKLKIPEYIATSYLLEAFQFIDQYKSIARERQLLLGNLNNLKIEQDKIVDRYRFLTNRFLPEKDLDMRTSAPLVRTILKDEHERSIQSKEKHAKLLEMTTDLEQLKKEHQHIESEVKQLLYAANAENENEFYELGEYAEKQAKQLERLKDLQKQLKYSSINKVERDSYLLITDCDERMSEVNNTIHSLQSRQSRLQEQYASLKHELQILEEGGLYSELLHQFKQKKYELEEDAKEWSVYRLAQDILAQTIEKYKNIHLPKMLSKAEEFLFFLTDGNYQKILLRKSGTGFLIERKDHTIFEANELSQATTEQVYVSIRLSLAITLFENYHFPIIIDDSFVNFDAKRTRKIMELLKQLKQNQILFFTCHTHLLEYFQQDNILYLHNGAIQTIS